MTEGAPALELRGITKRFGDLVANDAIDFDVRAGEVHALLGENGAGKTTAMRIAYGLTLADAGQVVVEGNVLAIRSPHDAIAAGVGMVTQHFALVRPMTVAENLVLGRSSGLRLDLAAAGRRAADASDRFGIRVDPSARVENLSIGQQQRVEILKALSRDCRILILDEPTAVLVPDEVEALFATLRSLVADGLAVVFISHKLAEVRAISDRVSVLRRGRLVGTVDGQTDERELARMMVGRPSFGVERSADAGAPAGRADAPYPRPARSRTPGIARRLRRVARGPCRRDRRSGGVSGNGQTELVEVLSGMRRPTGGSVAVADLELAGADPDPDDERRHRSHPGGPAREPDRGPVGRLQPGARAARRLPPRRTDRRAAGPRARDRADRAVRHPRPPRRSGGHPVGRQHPEGAPGTRPLARPAGAGRLPAHARPRRRGHRVRPVTAPRPSRRGAAILLVSEDLDELLVLADRLVVLYEGRIVGEMAVADANVEQLGMLMAGRGRAA